MALGSLDEAYAVETVLKIFLTTSEGPRINEFPWKIKTNG